MHPTAKETAEISHKAAARRLACVHIARFGTAQNVLDEAQAHFNGRVDVPNDGDRYSI